MEQPGQPQLSPLIIDGPPWEKKHEIGFFVGFIETIKAFLLHPAKTFAVMRRSAGIADALVYTVALQVFSFLWTFSIGGVDPSMLLPKDPQLLELLDLPENFSSMMVLIYPLSVILLQFISAYAFHLSLKWRGIQTYDFQLIFRIFAYASGTAALLMILPVIGGTASILLTVYIVYIGLKTIYGLEIISFILISLLALLIAFGLYLASALGIAIVLLLLSVIL